MPSYRSLGLLPPKRHIALRRDKSESFLGEGLYYEHIVTTAGFDRAYSIMYHLRPPTRNIKIEAAGKVVVEKVQEQELRHHHIRSQDLRRGGDPIGGRIPMLFNQDLVAWRCKPDRQQTEIYRNGAADEVIFIHQGTGVLETHFGRLPYRRGDYVVVPRTTNYRLVSDQIENEDHLILECFAPVRIPARYQNQDGQMYLGSPYYERDFHSPNELLTIDQETTTTVLVKSHEHLTRITMPHHPFDVVGWDGFVYPYTFNAWDFEPLTGTVHLPPPYQQTFEVRGFVICTFAPRHLDHHPEAIKVPYVHSNVEADEVLFYVDGEFGSRKGVELGSLTLHPGGIPHGPHPGTIMASMNVKKTEEMAVMFDTDRPLFLTPQALQVDDPNYPLSWMENGGNGASPNSVAR
ncbi:MAG TPA: homogentisate 1,2-dioxygenase [Pirellulaceae bacterium]|nr:homogentisate 1,2-dioxygenase [Pirellulaceae bacterium]HMO91296.1 homogentisate 1,2-dioxygenase [Pirellulaceae bacterium]HMP68520.1 homogentisate 1,2-dioxygenase [Pirellulaceae bacterium]